jgi:DNA-binding winged helix-turn-helix (wHTH) protein
VVQFRMLGPLEVDTSAGPVAITGRHHPRLLAMLLDDANQVVSGDRLAAGLWDDRPPSTAVRQVQNIAAALRRQLGPAGDRLRRIGSGYRIDVEADELDVLRCKRNEALAREHRDADRLVEAEGALDDAPPNGADRRWPASRGRPSRWSRVGSTTTGSPWSSTGSRSPSSASRATPGTSRWWWTPNPGRPPGSRAHGSRCTHRWKGPGDRASSATRAESPHRAPRARTAIPAPPTRP